MTLNLKKKLFNMNESKTIEKEFDTVNFFREVKEKIALETKNMSFKEFKSYLSKRKLRLSEK
jgi:hypothetical protein